jgi:hypothetical protein
MSLGSNKPYQLGRKQPSTPIGDIECPFVFLLIPRLTHHFMFSSFLYNQQMSPRQQKYKFIMNIQMPEIKQNLASVGTGSRAKFNNEIATAFGPPEAGKPCNDK